MSSEVWHQHRVAAEAAVKRLDWRTAQAEQRAALAEAERFEPGDPRLRETLRDLVGVQLRGYEAGEIVEPFAQRLLELQERFAGPTSDEVHTALHVLAQVLVKVGRRDDAEVLLRRALEIAERQSGPNAPAVANDLHQLGVRLWGTKRYAEAEAVFMRALGILRSHAPSPATIGIDAILECLAMMYVASEEPAKAEQVLVEWLRLAEANGADALQKASSYERLANAYREQGKYALAERTYQTTIEHNRRWLRQQPTGLRSSRVGAWIAGVIGAMYVFRAEMLRALGRERDARRCEGLAERTFKRSLRLQEARSKDGTDLAQAVASLAWFYWERGKPALAAPLYQRAIGLYRRAAEAYVAPADHAESSASGIREMYVHRADQLQRELDEMAGG